ncbi:MAG: M4 family metallopeptidase [Candidatus Kapabacteria bacterium]|nr:M4 family metallopeptidase [Candidatus Kapabacteria bacterium]
MKRIILFTALAMFLQIWLTPELSSQAFNYLKKSKCQLVIDASKKPTSEQLSKVAQKLSNIYYQYYHNNQNIVSSSTVPLYFKSKDLKQEDLFQRNNTLQFSQITYSNETGLPVFISVNKPSIQKSEMKFLTTQTIFSYLNENRNLFKIEDPIREFLIVNTFVDNENNKHIKLQQVYQKIPIWGKELILHFDNDNELYLINGKNVPSFQNFDANANLISKEQAITSSINDLSRFTSIREFSDKEKVLLNYNGPTVEKYIWFENTNEKPRLVWVIEIRNNFRDKWRYFIDAQTGEIIEKYNTSPTDGPVKATARDALGNNRTIDVYLEKGNYLMGNATKPMFNNNPSDPKGIILTKTNNNQDLTRNAKPVIVSSSNNQWNDAFSVSAHFNASLIFDYYKNTHGRNSIDDKGMNMLTIIHVTDNNQSFDNAYWNGQFVVLGDGGQVTNGWPPALDFHAHEFTHGVVTFTVDLEYKFQSGALNEAFADWGGCMVDREDWLLGEDIVKKQYFPTGCMRSMSDPHNGGTKGDHIWLPAHMNEFLDLPLDQDNGGVHYNCGIINKATYLIGNSIGKDKLEKIYYRVLNNRYITKQANFFDMRLACIKAAEELFGKNTNEVNVVMNSFSQVGIGEGSGSNPGPDLPPVDGTDWIALVSAQDFGLYIAKPVIQNVNTDIKKLTSTRVFTDNNGTLTVPENGSAILFIDGNNNLKLIKTDGTGEMIVDENPVWRSISISPNGQFLAATSVSEEPIIYLFDLVNSQFKEVEL